MLPSDILSRIAASCDACTRENLSNAVGTIFPPQKLSASRFIEIRKSQPRFHKDRQGHGESRMVYFMKLSDGITMMIESETPSRNHRYAFYKRTADGNLIYVNIYRTDNEHAIITSGTTMCTINCASECGCLLCSKHLQTGHRHLIAEMGTSHPWHLIPEQRFLESVEKYKHLGLCPEKYKWNK